MVLDVMIMKCFGGDAHVCSHGGNEDSPTEITVSQVAAVHPEPPETTKETPPVEVEGSQPGNGTGSGSGVDKEDSQGTKTKSLLEGIILVIALGIHSFFEGLLLGLAKTNLNLDSLFIGIVCHKAFVSFALGSSLARSSTVIAALICLGIFAS